MFMCMFMFMFMFMCKWKCLWEKHSAISFFHQIPDLLLPFYFFLVTLSLGRDKPGPYNPSCHDFFTFTFLLFPCYSSTHLPIYSLLKHLIVNLPHMYATAAPLTLPSTIPHHTPIIPSPMYIPKK